MLQARFNFQYAMAPQDDLGECAENRYCEQMRDEMRSKPNGLINGITVGTVKTRIASWSMRDPSAM